MKVYVIKIPFIYRWAEQQLGNDVKIDVDGKNVKWYLVKIMDDDFYKLYHLVALSNNKFSIKIWYDKRVVEFGKPEIGRKVDVEEVEICKSESIYDEIVVEAEEVDATDNVVNELLNHT